MRKDYRAEAIRLIKEKEEERIDNLAKELRTKEKKNKLLSIYKECDHNINFSRNGHRYDEYCTKCGWTDNNYFQRDLKCLNEKIIDEALKEAVKSL